ncbi:hypothetical protein [Terrimonas pollutisoli]|uniref:hypothetical protein n=1 Tax=Terrimonas pollutisoli TaxID=3034147 RepID=UPI0023ED2DA2|nr:hypothetical protein [Terrimonas sp. H1YJ31]
MKKLLGFLLATGMLALTSCETTREISFNKDGSGTMVTTTDMSSLIGIAKMSGQGKGMDSVEKAIDTTISLDKMADSIPDLTPEEKDLVRKGVLGLNVNMADEKLITKLQFPFTSGVQISKLDVISSKVMQQAMKKQASAGENAPPIPDDEMPKNSMDDYFTTTYGKNLIVKKHIPEKYAKVDDDKGMQALKEMAGQGMPMSNTLIFNLPSPAKKVEGKNVKLSEDKKKVTIVSSVDDFFDDITKLEFRIEY